MTKEEAKLKIIELIKRFKALDQHKIKSFNEASTKQGFIQPLFDALGWNFTDTDEVSPEDNTSNGRVDYAFKLHGVSQFFVEAKSFKEDLNDPKYIKQAISYAYNKGVTWAVLTNFHYLRVFNAQKTEPFISIDCNQYEADFERLWLLSRESLSSGLLNQEAIKWGVLPVPITIEKRLFTQLRNWREQLFNQIFLYNDKMDLKPEDVDGIIQKLFHRLIFIRTAEDRGIEEKGLLALLHQWKSAGAKGRLVDALRQLFIEYDGYYDSELFDQKLHHPLDNSEIFIQNDVIESICLGLYEIPGSMATYNFNDIDADVLGAVYEQYLGHVAEVMKQKAKEAQTKMDLGISSQTYTLSAKKERRKEQKLREYLGTKTTIMQIIDFGDAPVFEAITYPSIIVLRKSVPKNNQTHILTWNPTQPIDKFSVVVTSNSSQIPQDKLTGEGWQLESEATLKLLEKLRNTGKPLGEYVEGKFYRGITTGFNEAFVVNRIVHDQLIKEDTSSADLLKPFLRGRDVKRWHVEPHDLWLIFTRRGVDIKQYPAIEKYLAQYKQKLMPGVQGGRKPGIYEWYEIQDNIAYWREFEKPKIILGRFMNHATFAYDKDHYYHNDALYMIPGTNEYVVAILNSSVSWWFLSQICTDLQNGYLQAFKENLFQVPIPDADLDIQSSIKQLVSRIGEKQSKKEIESIEKQINQIAYKLYGLTEDEINIVKNI